MRDSQQHEHVMIAGEKKRERKETKKGKKERKKGEIER